MCNINTTRNAGATMFDKFVKRDVMFTNDTIVIARVNDYDVTYEIIFDFDKNHTSLTTRFDMTFNSQRDMFDDNEISSHIVDAIALHFAYCVARHVAICQTKSGA